MSVDSTKRFADPATIEWIVLDVDGVLTDGSVYLDDLGRETKRFDIKDGAGLKFWQNAGFGVAVITGRRGGAAQHRFAELGIGEVVQGSPDKRRSLDELCERHAIDPARIAYMGDDWPDLPAMLAVGYPTAPADAAPEVIERAAWVAGHPGGRGAVRQLCEHLLRSRGLFDGALGRYAAADPHYHR